MDKLIEIVQRGLEHSIAQAFLIFSGILVVICLLWVPNYISVGFLTLFYALINFKIEALRRHESFGKYAVGDRTQVILFTLISLLLLTWWATSVWTLHNEFNWQRWWDPSPLSWPSVSSYTLIFSLVFMMVWLWRTFSRLPKEIGSLEAESKINESNNLD